jgi:hypothetical protein
MNNIPTQTMSDADITEVTNVLNASDQGEFGDLTSLFSVGNMHRSRVGLPAMQLEMWRRLTCVNEFVKKVSVEIGEPAIRVKDEDEDEEKLEAHFYIMLDAAAYLSSDIKFAMYQML